MTDPQAISRYFVGEFEHTIDAVNRLVIPAKWRTGKSEEFFLLVRDAGSLAVLPKAELEKITRGIDADTRLNNSERRARRQVFSTASQVTCDQQGRFTIEARLLKQAGLKGSVVFVGGIERFEIWNPKVWEQQKADLASTTRATLEDLGL